MRGFDASYAMTKRFCADRQAVSAVEFALILPILILMLMGSFDVTRAIDAKNKSVLLSRTIADFVAQNSSVDTTQLTNIIAASKFVMEPYAVVFAGSGVPTGNVNTTVLVESINKKPDNFYWRDWSYPPASSTDKKLTETLPDISTIRATVTYTHKLKFTSFLATRIGFSQVVLTSSTIMSPRGGTPVTASGF
jgi:Flp pilus assembly protein TadG